MVAESVKIAAAKNDKLCIPGLAPTVLKAAKKKKKKTEGDVQKVASKLAGFTIEEPKFEAAPVQTPKAPAKTTDTSTAGTDPAKKLKNLKKKLKDTEILEQKVKSGELKKPDADQLEKIKRKPEVVKEIRELEKLVK